MRSRYGPCAPAWTDPEQFAVFGRQKSGPSPVVTSFSQLESLHSYPSEPQCKGCQTLSFFFAAPVVLQINSSKQQERSQQVNGPSEGNGFAHVFHLALVPAVLGDPAKEKRGQRSAAPPDRVHNARSSCADSRFDKIVERGENVGIVETFAETK